MSRHVRATALAALVFVLAACGHPAAQVQPTPRHATSPAPIALPSPSHTPTTNQNSHVFVIVMENHSYGRALQGRYTAQLAAKYATATDYHAVGFPSLPNYLALTSIRRLSLQGSTRPAHSIEAAPGASSSTVQRKRHASP